MQRSKRILGPIACGPNRAAIRAKPAYQIEREVDRRMAALELGGRIDPQWHARMARALRDQRRAARRGGFGYDLLRHMALLRIERGMRRGARRSWPFPGRPSARERARESRGPGTTK
jgi:hypothetical protein